MLHTFPFNTIFVHNSITSTVMRGLLELQESVYRSFAMAKYGNDSLSNLSSHEKERLELIVQIYPGCTELVAEIRGLVREIKELLIDMLSKNSTEPSPLSSVQRCRLYCQGNQPLRRASKTCQQMGRSH